jgi:tetratricopeptide (TPR) repeat protein
MNASRRQRVWEVFDGAAGLPAGERAAFLDGACAGEPGLRAEVESLLAHDLQSTAVGAAGDLLRSPLVRGPRGPDPSPPATHPMEAPTLPASPAPPARVGRYRILRLLGEGGMGAVYEAEQDSPRRPVALKAMRPGPATPSLARRFAHEAQVLGRLQHPGIAQVYEAGVADDGQPFFALELIRGLPLDEYARRQGLGPAARLELVARVCDAVQHAHEQGVLHRDLKPANVLVDESGQPKVLDFGIARALENDPDANTHLTGTGQLVGTPAYMSPEQAGGNSSGLDARSDVYALGVLLYELLTGRLPYDLDHLPLSEVVRVIREQEPPRLGALDTRLRGDAETIAAKALAKDRGQRYPSAAELAADLRRHLRSEPILARPPSALYHLGKFARRHKVLVATTAVSLAVLLAAGGVAAWKEVQLARAEQDRAARQARRSHEVLDALARAGVLREQARAADDLGLWAKARAEARGAEALAEDGKVEEGLAERVAALCRGLDEEEADRRLVARLEEVRLRQFKVTAREERFAEEWARREYGQVFAARDLRPGHAPAEAADRIRSRPPAVRGPVLGALDHWLDLAQRQKAPEAGWLERVLSDADTDGWRKRLRAARRRGDRGALEELAREVEAAAQPPQALFLLGLALRASGSTQSTVRLLQRAQQAYPGDFWLNHNLGEALMQCRPPQLDEAIRFFTAALVLRPKSPGAHLNLGIALAEKGRLDDAIDAYQHAIALRPDYAPAHNNLGKVLFDLKRPAQAEAALRKAIAFSPDEALEHFNLGTLLYSQKKLPEAEAAFRRAIALQPYDAEAYTNLGVVLEDRKKLAGAEAAFRKAIALNPKSAPARNNLGNVLRDRKKLPGAEAAFRKAIALKLDFAEAYNNLGNVLAEQKRPAEAEAAFRKAIALKPDYAPAHRGLGDLLHARKKLAGAEAAFRKAIALEPEDAPAYNNLGNVLYEQKKADQAEAAFRKAVALKPDYAEAHNNLGFVLFQRKRFAQAEVAHRRAIALKPDFAEAHNNLGNALREQEKLAWAEAAFRKAIALKPAHGPAHYNLGNLLYSQEKLPQAEASYRRAIALIPDYPETYYNLGQLLYGQGKLAGAEAAFRKAIALRPEDAEAHCTLGHVLVRRGEFGAALTAFRAGHDLGSRQKDWRYPSAAWVKKAEWLLDLSRKLPLVLAGKQKPADESERIGLARLCQQPYQRRYAASARFWKDVFRDQPELADDLPTGHRYNAACAAALAGCGQGRDADNLDARERAGWRDQAHTWLQADFLLWKRSARSRDAKVRQTVQARLRSWKQDTDLAGVRDSSALAQLPAAERDTWCRLWAEVAAVLAQLGPRN